MAISANVTNSQISATVKDDKITASVSAGFGPQGTAATVTVGSVTTGAAGTSASVVNAGSSSAAVLNFTIPAGATGAQGQAGATGATGAAGAAATVSVGSVSTGAAGSSASVTNVGTSNAAVLNFSIPAGATGATGPQGATGPAGTTTWAGITDKPSTFTPSAHTHGSLTNDGKIGTATGKIVVTTTGGALTAASYVSGEQVLVYSGQTSATLSGSLADFLVPIGAQGMGLVDIVDYLGAAQATALDAKAPIASPTFTGTVSGVTKAMVGLGSVDNTADASKPVSTAQAAADAAVQAYAIQRANHTGTQAASTITGLASVATSGSASDLSTGTLPAARIPATAVTAGSYGSLNQTVSITVGADGRLTSVSSGSITVGASAVAFGTFDVARIPTGTTSSTVSLGNHVHGNISNTGAIGSTSGQIVVTTTSGVLTTAATISNTQVSGLGSLATQSGTFSGTSSGTNTGDQTISLTGDVTGSGTGAFAATLASSGVTAGSYGSASSVATFTVDAKGRLTVAGTSAIAIAASDIVSGTVAAARLGSGATSTNFLRGDQTYANPITYATTAQAQDGTSTSVAMNPSVTRDAALNWIQFYFYGSAVTNSGTATQSPVYPSRYNALSTTTTTGGTGVFPGAGTPGGAYLLQGLYSGQAVSAKNWAVTQAFLIRAARVTSAANSVFRVQWGEKTSANTFAQLSGRGIGFEVRSARLWLLAHDGTTLTQYDTGIDVTGGAGNSSVPFDMLLTSSGGTLSFSYSTAGSTTTGSTSGAPTTLGSNTSFFCAELTNGASATACTFHVNNPMITIQ